MYQIEPKPSTKDINHALKEIQNGNKKPLETLLEKYPKLHWSQVYYEKTGDTALHCASRLNLVNIIDYLLSNCTQKCVDCKNKDDKTALHEAAQFGQYEACKILVRHGADVNALKRADWTPLMLACTKCVSDNIDIIKLLLENGAIVNYRNKDGWTVLHLISREGDVQILKTLIDHGVDIKLKTKNGRTALHIAALHRNADTVTTLLNVGVNVDEEDTCGNTALHEGVLGGSITVCTILVDRGADVSKKNNRGYNLLHLAASEGHLHVIDYVLNELKCDINDTTTDGFTALHCAVRNNQKQVFDYLISKGADARIQDKCGRNAMSYKDWQWFLKNV